MKKLLAVLVLLTGITVLIILTKTGDRGERSCTRVNELVNDVLVENKVNDTDILSRYWKEHKEKDTSWVETVQEIRLKPGTNVNQFKIEFSSIVQKCGFEVYEYVETSNTFKISIGRDDRIYQNILFYHPVVTSFTRKRIAIVIDDVGYLPVSSLDAFLNLKIPVTFSIMPMEKYSKEIAKKLMKLKYPYLLHQPLEPLSYPNKDNPGKFALFMATPVTEYDKIFSTNLKSVLSPVGMNNHMGSRFTGDEKKMKLLLQLVKKNRLFFFDSMTNMKSVGMKVAKQVHVPCVTNDIFLDRSDDLESIKKEYMTLLKFADKKGYAVAIGHIHKKNTVEVLKQFVRQTSRRGYRFVFLTELVDFGDKTSLAKK